jgi:probable rRNA maturation factor
MTGVQVAAANQGDRDVDLDRWARLAREVLEAEGVTDDAELSLLFVDEDTIAGLNHRFMGEAGPTDVLAFPLDAAAAAEPDVATPDVATGGQGAEQVPRLLGDVVVCPAVAARQAAERGGDTEAEMALLVVHGILHILGHDHAEPYEARRMEARQTQLLGQLYRSRGEASPWSSTTTTGEPDQP